MKFTTSKDELRLELHGKEQLWAVRAQVKIARKHVKDVRFEKKFKDWKKWEVRMPGASIPGHLVAGSYWTEDGWDFIYATNPQGLYKPDLENVLIIETDQNRFKRIIVSMSKKEADPICKWFKKS